MRNRLPPGYIEGIRQIPPAPFSRNPVCPTDGGYAVLSDNEMGSIEIGKTQQLYYSRPVTNSLNPEPALFFNANTLEIELASADTPLKGERPWTVSINAIETFRIAEELPLPRISKDAILSLDGPRYSTLQALIKVMDGSAKSKYIKVDVAGGTTIPVFGRNVQVSILAPSNTQLIEPSSPEINLSGITFNTIVSAKVAPIASSFGNFDILKYTWLQGVEAGETEFVEIPPSARRVRILNSSVGVATTTMYFWLTNDPAGHVVGIIDFVTANDTLDINIPCGATHISTGPVDDENNRCFVFIFLIDP